MPRLVMVAVVCLAALFGSAAAVSAQPDHGTVFIGAGALASVERNSQSSGSGITTTDVDGTVPGGTLELGVYLAPRLSARFEWSMTGWLEYDGEPIVYPLYAAGVALPGTSIIGTRIEGRRTAKMGAALLAYHVGSRRASVQLLGGLGFLSQTTRTTFNYRFANPRIDPMLALLPYPSSETRTTTYDPVGVAGADAAVALTDHASVVPQFRVFAANGVLRMRPTLGIRWTF